MLCCLPLAPLALYIKLRVVAALFLPPDLLYLFGTVGLLSEESSPLIGNFTSNVGGSRYGMTSWGVSEWFVFFGFVNQLTNIASVERRKRDAIIRFTFSGEF